MRHAIAVALVALLGAGSFPAGCGQSEEECLASCCEEADLQRNECQACDVVIVGASCPSGVAACRRSCSEPLDPPRQGGEG
jgi:hypothetical protein